MTTPVGNITSSPVPPENAEHHARRGRQLLADGDFDGAINSYEAVANGGGRAEWLHQLGVAYAGADRIVEAEASYRAALAIDAGFVPALFELGMLLYHRCERPDDAVIIFKRLRECAPNHVEVHQALGDAFRALSLVPEAISSYRDYVNCRPESPLAHADLGSILSEAGDHDEAIACLKRAILLDPENRTHARFELADALLRSGKREQAQECLRQTAALKPRIIYPSILGEAKFSAVLIAAQGFGNTPYGHLVRQRNYDIHLVPFMADATYDAKTVCSEASVIVNLVSDPDEGRSILPQIERFIEDAGLPTINRPSQILLTDRVSVARILSQVDGCRIAPVGRFNREALCADALPADVQKLQRPFLARVAGSHSGKTFEKIEEISELRDFVSRNPARDYYLINYLDYQSADGYFRKYRFFCVDGEIFAYHLAIAQHWKAHHFSTDMASHSWMQIEEEAFLTRPSAVFGARQTAVLQEVVKAVGLEFMAIDCSIDRGGNVVVFEANATMLLNGNNSAFPYKIPYVRRIRDAFGAMLARRAASVRRPR